MAFSVLFSSKEMNKAMEIMIMEDPQKLRLILNMLSWKILVVLSEKEMYPLEIAKKLGVHEQKVYYHMRKLAKAGAIVVAKEEEKKGATAKFYHVSFPAFGVELPFGNRRITTISTPIMDQKLRNLILTKLKLL